MSHGLTPGTIKQIWQGEEKTLYKILQVIEVSTVSSGKTKLVLSDSEYYQQALLTLPPNDLALNKLAEFCLVLIVNYEVKVIDSGVKVVLITGLNYLDNPGRQIGNPRNLETLPAPAQRSHPVVPPPRNEVDRSAVEGYAPIKALTTMMSDWVIKARVVSKDPVKEWNNARGSGKLFSCTLMDAHGTEIQATFFQDGVDKYYNEIEEGQVYTFSNGQVKLARAGFNRTSNDYQLNFDGKAMVQHMPDDSRIGALKFNLVSIDQLRVLQKNSIVDICAVVAEVGELADIVSKKGDQLSKRVLKLVDQSRATVELTLWGDFAKLPFFNNPENLYPKPILLAKSLRTSDFNGISLSADKTSKLFFNEEEHEPARVIKRWRDSEMLRVTDTIDLSIKSSGGPMKREFKTIKEIKAIWEGPSPPLEELSYGICGTIGIVKHDDPNSMWYTACKNGDKCKKKVTMESNGTYRCESCQESFAECERRYIMSLRVHDSTGQIWATAFDDCGLTLLGRHANDLYRLTLSESTRDEFDQIVFEAIYKQFEMTVRVKIQEGPQGPKPRYTVSYASPINQKRMTDLLLREITEAFEKHHLAV